MTIENQAAPDVEAQNTTPEPTEKPEIVEPGATDSAALEGDESEAKPEKTAEQKELERLRRQLTKRDRTQGKLYQELQTTRQQLEQFSSREPGEQQEAPDPYKLAAEMAAIKEVNERSNKVAKEGEKRFSDFFQSLERVTEDAGEMFDGRGRPTAIGEAILDSEDPAGLIDFLGKNPDLAAELEGLSPTKLGRRIERLETQMKARPKPVSKASEPISPIKGSAGSVVKTLESMTPSEYAAYRAKNGARWAR